MKDSKMLSEKQQIDEAIATLYMLLGSMTDAQVFDLHNLTREL